MGCLITVQSAVQAGQIETSASLKTVLLINFVAPYRSTLLRALANRLGSLRILVSTPMEPNRAWVPDWHGLDVALQRTLTLPWEFRRRSGARQQIYIHFPFDTLPRLLGSAPDVVISGELGLRSLQAAMYRMLRPRSRLVIWATLSEHTEVEWGLMRRMLRRVILGRADAVVVNGRSGARYIASFNADVPVVIMRQPVDVALFARAPLERAPSRTRRLIFSGRLVDAKGVVAAQAAIAAWALSHPDRKVELTWAGDGAARAALEAAEVPINLRQHFAGELDYVALARLYGESDALILPTLFDEWGLVVNEALASGIPVLGSIYSQAVEELIEDGVTGWRFDPLSKGSLESALDRFFATSPEELAEMRRRSRACGLSITFETAAISMMEAIEATLPARQTA
jgi:glycosyltransferase involved in cell wall biosynthesis